MLASAASRLESHRFPCQHFAYTQEQETELDRLCAGSDEACSLRWPFSRHRVPVCFSIFLVRESQVLGQSSGHDLSQSASPKFVTSFLPEAFEII